VNCGLPPAWRAMAEQRLPDGFRHLPTVPRTGRATELLPRILLTKCPDTLRKSHSKRKQHLVSQPCSKGLSAQKLSKASFRNGKHPNFGRFLVQEDHLAKLQFPKTVLAPGGDTGQHDVGMALKALEEKSLVTEEKDVLASLNSFWEDSSLDLDPTTSFRNEGIETSQELYPSVCRSWAAQQAYCRSLMSSRNESRMNTPNTRPITSRSDTMVTELCPQHRREALQHSFSIFPEEVAARLKDMRRRPVGDYHIDLPDSLADESGSSAPQSSATNLSCLDLDVKPHPVPAPKRKSSKTGSSEDSDRSVIDARNGKGFSAPETLEELRDLVQGAQLTMVPFKEQPSPELMTLGASDSDLPDANEPEITSPREELLRAVKLLNIFRWFCRLPAVHVEEDDAEVCDLLSDALLLRQPVYLPESHHIARRVLDLGHQLGGYLAKGDSTIMLHKESSLISAISVGMLCSHTVGWSYASAPAPGQNAAAAARVCLKEEMMQRAARHCDWHAETFPQESPVKGGFATWMSFSKVTEPVVLQNLPDALGGYRTLFEISDQWMAECYEEPKIEKNLRPEPPARPRTNGSSSGVRSRPGTVGTVGTVATTSREERPTTSSSRVRQVLWGSSESAKRREWSRACNLSWGDRSKSMMLRRKLLNPKLRSLGGSRVNDTCILRAPHCADANKEEEPDFVIFPPEGVCPMELLVGCHLPTWTIMPDSGQYQPGHSLQVRMWRVRLLRRSPTESPELEVSQSLHRRLSKYSSPLLPEEPPYDAIRLEELPLSFLTCDCSAEGNSFCIIFRPHLPRICEGDQIEVELSGLSGSSERHHFFHDFRSCADLEWQDHEFFEEIQKFCKLFSDIDAFKGPRTFSKSLSRSLSMSMPKDGSLPELRPISHLEKDFKTDDIEFSMYFYCVGVAAFEATLYLQRSDGEIKVERSTLVYHLDDYFLVRVKLPCSVSKYELGFRISTNQRPRKLVDYPLRYGIRSLESRSFPLTTVEDPPSQKYQRYGFCPVPPAAHLLGLTILAPMEYGLSPGSLYFLVHVHPRNLPVEVPPEPVGEVHPTELFARLRQEQQEVEDHALEKEIIKQKDPLFSDDSDDATRLQDLMQRRNFQNAQRMMLHRPSVAAMDPTINVMRRLHHGLEHHLSERTQDLPQNLHFDLMVREGRSNKQRFAIRMTRKLGHPEFYEGVVHFADHDPGAKIELYYRITEEVDRAPLKVAEWRVGRIDIHLDD